MSAYATLARIERASPRLVIGRPVWPEAEARAVSAESEDVVLDVVVRDPLIERVAAARERWTQLTFYLFEAQSWR